MKLSLFILVALLVAVPSFASEKIQADSDAQVWAPLVEGHSVIPSVGDLEGSVVTVFAGGAMGLRTYYVSISNTMAPGEGDDFPATQTFSLFGFSAAPKAVYSRRVDQNTYSVAVVGDRFVAVNEKGEPIKKRMKVLLRIRFTAEGIEKDALMEEIAQ